MLLTNTLLPSCRTALRRTALPLRLAPPGCCCNAAAVPKERLSQVPKQSEQAPQQLRLCAAAAAYAGGSQKAC